MGSGRKAEGAGAGRDWGLYKAFLGRLCMAIGVLVLGGTGRLSGEGQEAPEGVREEGKESRQVRSEFLKTHRDVATCSGSQGEPWGCNSRGPHQPLHT